MLSRRPLLAAALLLPFAARAQGFPDRPLRYVVPFPPGGITDQLARLLAARLADGWGRPVVVENRAGGNGLIGADAVAKAPPDGYSILAITSTHTVNASLFPNAPYDFLRDLRTVALLGQLPLVATVRADGPIRSLNDLVQAARTRPLSGGSSGIGTPAHLALELFRRSTGAGPSLVHVPYRGGAPAVTDLVGGTLDFLIQNLPEVLPQIQGGRLRALAVTATQRHPSLPDIPTTAEAGLPDLVFGNWTGVAVPRATPDPIVAALAAAIARGMTDPELRRRGEEAGFTLLASTPAEAEAFAAQEVARWARLIAEANIKAE